MKKLILLFLFMIPLSAQKPLIFYKYKKGEIAKKCDELAAQAKKKLDQVAALDHSKRNFKNTIEAMENITAELDEKTNPPTFMAYISTDAQLRKEASAAEEKLSQFYIDLSLRKDLYEAFSEYKKRNADEIKKLSQAQKRLLEIVERNYRQNGLTLPVKERNLLQKLKKEHSALKTKFSKNLREYKKTIHFAEEELKGTPNSFRKRLKKDKDGKYILSMKYPDYVAVIKYASSSKTRQKMQYMFYNRAAPENTKLLEKAVAIRYQIAKLLGYKNWFDYRTDGRMAKNHKNVKKFLTSLQKKLAKSNAQDLEQLLQIKQKDFPQAKELNVWDIGYYSTRLKKDKYQFDDQVVREYFPVHLVIKGTFDIYSKLLGVSFREVKEDTWHKDVKLFEIIDKNSKKRIAYFYADLYPREGKYGHAAAFGVRQGRMLPSGQYQEPISAIVANLEPPVKNQPSLLPHRNVETFFHEFGHIMHQTLTKAPYASISGTSVSRDFVEAPSQMLENWIWDDAMLSRISGHYKDETKKLPEDLKYKLLKLKHFNSGINYMRQVLYASIDLLLHTGDGKVDATAAYRKLFKEITALELTGNPQWLAGFGHLMGGYDAGYYGYLWSEVYAQDMFTVFAKSGLLDQKTGMKYRQVILERGNMQNPEELVREFLGRDPDNQAFLKQLGIEK